MVLKLRLEAEVVRGDVEKCEDAVADALEAAARHIRAGKTWQARGVIDVPRGKLAYDVERKAASWAMQDDGA